MHPWHDIYVDEQQIAQALPAVIEVPQGSKNKYEVDKETGFLRLDSLSLGAVGPLAIPINQVAGFYSGGVLTLSIAYETVDATMLLTLTTF